MTLDDLMQHLHHHPKDAPLVFYTDAGEIRGGYHVTELKLGEITSIDCGARTAQWSEAALQLLDGRGGAHMTIGTFRAIVGQSLARVPGLAEVPVHVEFGPGNRGLRRYDLSKPMAGEGGVRIALRETRAHCKPFAEALARIPGAACCGAGPVSSCCG